MEEKNNRRFKTYIIIIILLSIPLIINFIYSNFFSEKPQARSITARVSEQK